jgi:hypothetical protein
MAWSNHHYGVGRRLGDWLHHDRSVPQAMMYSHFYHAIYAAPEQALARTMDSLAKKFPDYEWKHHKTDVVAENQLFVIVCEGIKKCCAHAPT